MENQLLNKKDIADLLEFLKYCGGSLLNDLQYYSILRQKISDPNVEDTYNGVFDALKEKNRLVTLLDAVLHNYVPEKEVKQSYKFFLNIDTGNDEFADSFEITINRDLLIDDIIDLHDHEIAESIDSNTKLFRVVKRQFSLEYQEMFLKLEPYEI